MKSYCDKSTAKRGFIRMGGDAERFESVAKEVDGNWVVDDSALPNRAGRCKKVAIRRRGYPPVDMSKHKTGDALIAHIKAFDRSRNLHSGNIYHIGGKEVRI